MERTKFKILLVEDNPGDIILTREAFAESSVQLKLDTVTDGAAAIEYLRQQKTYQNAPRPDLILLDLNLPKKSGIEILQDIKFDADLQKIPVIVLTTSASPKDIDLCYKNHANCYIKKPIDFDSFLEVIKMIEKFWLKTALLPESL